MTANFQDSSESSQSDVSPKLLTPRRPSNGRVTTPPPPEQSKSRQKLKAAKECCGEFWSTPASTVLVLENAVMWGAVIGVAIMLTFLIVTLVLRKASWTSEGA
jgi:hypothetical protein